MSKAIKLGDTKLFEVRLLVAYHDYDEHCDLGAMDWLMNILTMASSGKNIETGAQAFLTAMLGLEETELSLHRVEKDEETE